MVRAGKMAIAFRMAIALKPPRCLLAANPPLFPCLAEQPLGTIEPLLRFCELLSEVLDTTFNLLEPRSDVGRRCLGTSGTQTSELENRVSRDPHEYQEGGEKYGRLQVALLVWVLRLTCAS